MLNKVIKKRLRHHDVFKSHLRLLAIGDDSPNSFFKRLDTLIKFPFFHTTGKAAFIFLN